MVSAGPLSNVHRRPPPVMISQPRSPAYQPGHMGAKTRLWANVLRPNGGPWSEDETEKRGARSR